MSRSRTKRFDGDAGLGVAAHRIYGVRVTNTVAMAADGNGGFSANVDTSPADAGPLFWWAQSSDSPKSAVEGRVIIVANPAAPQG